MFYIGGWGAATVNHLKRIADILIASWTIANERVPLPASQGILDNALKRAVDAGHFPQTVREALHFVPTSVGNRCAELRAVLAWAQASELTSDPNPSYSVTHSKISKDVAREILHDLGIVESEAATWGRALAEEIKRESVSIGEFERA